MGKLKWRFIQRSFAVLLSIALILPNPAVVLAGTTYEAVASQYAWYTYYNSTNNGIITPTDDTGSNYFGMPALLVGSTGSGSERNKVALSFDMTPFVGKNISSAVLRLYIPGKVGNAAFHILGSPDTSWTEGTDNDLTDGTSNFPSSDGTSFFSGIIDEGTVNNWISFILDTPQELSYFMSQTNSSSKVTLVVTGSTSGDNYFGIADRTTGLFPRLAVTYNTITPLGQVSNVTLSNTGAASWNAVANASSYSVQLYKGGNAQGAAVSVATGTTSYDFLSAMRAAGVGSYTVKVQAMGDGTNYSNGAVSTASSPQNISQLSTVSAGLSWSGNTAMWTAVSNAVSYDVQLYKDGSASGPAKNILASNAASGADFTSEITNGGGGTYTYKVTAKGDGNLLLDALQSIYSNDNIKSILLTQVSIPSLSSAGIATWTNVTHASGYLVQLYKAGSALGTAVSKTDGTAGHDFLADMRTAGAGSYTVKVTAQGDGTYYSDAPESLASAAQTVIQLSAVSAGLNWSGDTACWTTVSNAVSYDVQLYKDGSAVGSAKNVLSASASSGADFSTEIAGAGYGSFTYKVTARGNGGLILDASTSAASSVNFKATPLGQVANPVLSASGYASWDAVIHASSYMIRIKKDGTDLGESITTSGTYCNILSDLRSHGAGVYTFNVTAVGDGINYSDGTVSPDSGSQTVVKLSTVSTGLVWSGNTAHWSAVSNAVSYDVQLYKDGSVVSGALKNITEANRSAGADFSTEITANGGGTYTYRIVAKGNGILLLDADQSASSADNIKAIQLAQPANVTLSSAGLADWEDISHEAGYSVQLYKDGNAIGPVIAKNADETDINFLSDMRAGGAGTYTVRVTAVGDGIYYTNGAPAISLTGQTVSVLSTAGTRVWSGNTAHFAAVANASSYEIQLYKDGGVLGAVKTVTAANRSSGVDFSAEISGNGAGTYTFTVKAIGNGLLNLDGAESLPSGNNILASVLAQVGGVTLSSTGIASWNDSTDESSYSVQLYRDGTAAGSAVTVNANTVSYDFLSAIRSFGAGIYTVKVKALGDGVYFSDGLPSSSSAGQTVEKLATANGMHWVGNKAEFTSVTNAVSYLVQLYKNGSTTGPAKSVSAVNAASGVDFSNEIANTGVGRYTFKVTAMGDNGFLLDADQSVFSPENVSTSQLSQVTGLTLSTEGVLKWMDITGETGYSVQMYLNGAAIGSAAVLGADVSSYNALDLMRNTGPGTYTAKVTSTGDGIYYLDGTPSDFSNSQVILQPAAVSDGLIWTGSTAKWTGVEHAVSYNVQLYKNNTPVGSVIPVSASEATNGVDFNNAILLNGFGAYTYQVQAKGNDTLVLDADSSAASGEYVTAAELTTLTFDKNTASSKNTRLNVSLQLDSSLLHSIHNGSDLLKENKAYTLSGQTLTLAKDYLKKLNTGKHTLTIQYSNGDSQTVTIKVINTALPASAATAASETAASAEIRQDSSATGTKAVSRPASGTSSSTGQGKFEVQSESSSAEVPSVTLPLKQDLYDAALTDEDRAAIAAGKNVSIKIVVNEVKDPADADIVKENLGDNTFGMFLDISILKTIGDQVSETHNLNKPITLTFDIPKELKGYASYAIIRVHNGESVILVDEDNDPDTITFSTDRFSTYALVYQDNVQTAAAETKVSDTQVINTEAGNTEAVNTEVKGTAQNGKQIDLLWILAACFAVILVLLTGFYTLKTSKKRKK